MSSPTLEIDASALRRGLLFAPVSKSDAVRALVLAHALGWPELVEAVCCADAELPADVCRVRDGLAALSRAHREPVEVDCADGAAPFRFLLAQAAVCDGAHVGFTGTARLAERPHGPLFEALARTLGSSGLRLGAPGRWPLAVRGAARAPAPVFRVSGAESSQFASSLVLAAAGLARREGRPWAVEHEGPMVSRGYFELTVDWAARCGVPLERRPGGVLVWPAEPRAAVPPLPRDASSLAYLLLLSWKSGACVTGLSSSEPHPDTAMLDHLAALGLSLEPLEAGTLRVVGRARGGLRASAAAAPDLVPTLAALACVLDAPSVFTEVGLLKAKESDRLEGTLSLARAAGAAARLDADTLTISPRDSGPAAFTFSSRGDHRLAMSAATLAVLVGARLQLLEPDCVGKSFPGFWAQLEKVARVTEGAGSSARALANHAEASSATNSATAPS